MMDASKDLPYDDYWFNYVFESNPLDIKKIIQEKYIISDGLKIHLDIFEKKNSLDFKGNIIFIHGTSVYSRFYADFCYKLSQKGFRIIAPDLIGHGLSEGKRGHFTMKDITKMIYNATSFILNTYKEDIAIMGSSLGGIAALYSAAYDSRLKAAICHNAAIFNEKAYKKIVKITGVKKILMPLIPYIAKIFPNLKLNTFSYLPAESLANSEKGFKIYYLIEDDKISVLKYTFTSLRTQMCEPLSTPIEIIKTPLLIINGDQDGLFSVEYINEIFKRLNCREKKLEIIEGAAHFIFHENIDEVLHRIIPWLEKIFKD